MQNQEQPQATPDYSQYKFMTVKGIDKVEALWFNRTIGTVSMSHPVALKRAGSFLEEVRKQAANCIFLREQAC